MNLARHLNNRLFKLFPVKLLKDQFDLIGTSEEIIEEILNNNNQQSIIDFVNIHYVWTRQHIYLMNLSSNFNNNMMNGFPYEISNYSLNNGTHSYLLLPKVVYSAVLNNPPENSELHFYQPYIIKITGLNMSIHVTKVEKTVSSYYPINRRAIKTDEVNNETFVMGEIINFLNNVVGVNAVDSNAGVKHLWNIDFIDGKKVQWRKNSSAVVETMDEDLLFKQRYPQEYAALILQPLNRTLFKYLIQDDYLCELFEINPSKSIINIPRFPKNANQVSNVISEILANN